VIQVHGHLLAPPQHVSVIELDYTGANNSPATTLVRTNEGGFFDASLRIATGTRVSALWAGDTTHAPVVTGPIFPSKHD
jgi:hypothetical protein